MAKSSKVIGLDDWMDLMDKEVEVLENRVKRAVHKRGHLVERDAKKLAPVLTGELRQSIETDIQDDGYSAEISAQAINPNDGADYAIFQEEGTVNMDAQPFMQPALENQAPKLEADLKNITRQFGR